MSNAGSVLAFGIHLRIEVKEYATEARIVSDFF